MPEDTHTPSPSQGILWKTDRNATHDGPGIRTALYFKGCPLKCKWCSNPEGQIADPILIFQKSKCTDCEICIEVCPVHALERQGLSEIRIHRSRCDLCGDCVSKCPTEALQIWGQSYTVPEVLQLLEKDRMIHRRSGGGVTCTGGDPLDQEAFLLELLEQCRRQGIHTAVETSAYANEELFKRVLQLVDLLFIDIKHMDPQRHLELTGRDNALILAHCRLASTALQARGRPLLIRQVVVPGITDGENIKALADFVASLPFVTGVELLPYHNYGIHKYGLRGIPYGLEEIKQPSTEEMEKWKKVVREKGLTVV
jgi:pyruvate formate lyase activating enzyme